MRLVSWRRGRATDTSQHPSTIVVPVDDYELEQHGSYSSSLNYRETGGVVMGGCCVLNLAT